MLALLAAAWIPGHPTRAQTASLVDFGVETEADYARFKDRLFVAETVRVDYIGNPRPRVYGTLVGLLAFAEANPLATPGQLSAFLERWDASLRVAVTHDPDLRGPGSLALAVRYRGFVEPSEVLLGTDTRVGLRALRLLGLDPGPVRDHEVFSNVEKRTSLIEQAARLDLRYAAAAADIVLLTVHGRTADGRAVNGMSEAATGYLREEGLGAFSPQTPEDHSHWEDLRESWWELPTTLDEAVLLLNGTGFESQLAQEFESLNNLAKTAVERIREAISSGDGLPAPTLLETFEENRDNPAALNEALEGLVSQREAIARRHASFEFRARVFAMSATFAQQPNRRLSAEEFRRMGSSQASGNDILAGIEKGIKIGQAVSGIASGNPLDMAGGALELAGLFGLGGPSAEELILEQLGALQDQLTLFRDETLDRLETIDAKLNAIYELLAIGFGNVLNNQEDMLSILANLKQAVAEQTVALRRFESRLFEVLEFEGEVNFRTLFNTELFRSLGFDRFRDTLVEFDTWAVERAPGPLFSPRAEGLAGEAASVLPHKAPHADQQLNFLNAYSEQVGGPPLLLGAVTSLANPRVYAKAADAYGLLMEQHPWYAAVREEGAFITAVNRLRAPGVDLLTAAAQAGAVTEGTDVIDAALANYRAQLEGLERSLYDPDSSPQGEGVVLPWLFAVNPLSLLPLLEFNQPENFSTGFEPLRRIPFRPRFAAQDFEVVYVQDINGEIVPCETHWFGDEDDESCGNENLPGCTDPNLGLFVHEIDFGAGTPPRGRGVVSDALRTLWRLGLVESHTAIAYVKTVGSTGGANAIDIDIEIQAVVPTVVLRDQADCGRSLGPRGTIESDVQIRILAGGFSPPLDGLLQRLVQDRPDVLFDWLDDPLAHLGQPSGSVEFDSAPLDPAGNVTVAGPFTLTLAEVTVEYDELGERVAKLQQQFFDLFEPNPETADLLEPQLRALESAFLVLRSLVEFGRPDAVQRSKVARTAFDGERVSSVGLSAKNVTEFIRAHSGFGAPLPRLDGFFDRVRALQEDVGVGADEEGPAETGRLYAVQWALANLEAQRRDRTRLATPDTFIVVAGQTLEILPEDLLANDARNYGISDVARQAILSDEGCENTAGAIQAAGHGPILVATTEADAGKALVFSYVAEGSFGSTRREVRSAPACVVIRVVPAVDGIRLGGVWQAGGFRLTVDGPAGASVRVQRSADLVQWEDVDELTLGDGPGTVEDSAVTELRFYRTAIH